MKNDIINRTDLRINLQRGERREKIDGERMIKSGLEAQEGWK